MRLKFAGRQKFPLMTTSLTIQFAVSDSRITIIAPPPPPPKFPLLQTVLCIFLEFRKTSAACAPNHRKGGGGGLLTWLVWLPVALSSMC